MNTIDDIRRTNLQRLVKQAGGVGRLAEQIGKDPSQLSQWLNASPDSKTGKPRGIRSATCRAIEHARGLPEGWLDAQHSAEAPSPTWPFVSIDPRRYDLLPERVKGMIEGRVAAMIDEWEADTAKSRKTTAA